MQSDGWPSNAKMQLAKRPSSLLFKPKLVLFAEIKIAFNDVDGPGKNSGAKGQERRRQFQLCVEDRQARRGMDRAVNSRKLMKA